MIIHNAFGVDLGTSAVKVYCHHTGQTIAEKNMIAIRNGRQVLAVGDDAFEMYEKAPDNIQVSRPVMNGRIADVAQVEYVLHTMIGRADRSAGYAPMIFFSAPVNMSEIEKRAYYSISHAGYFRSPRVYLVDRPVCDAISLGINIPQTRGSMIVNIGGQNTDISVIANEQVIISTEISIGGQHLNEAICNEIRRQENLIVGRRTARRLKAVLATLGEDIRETRQVTGMNTLSGLPRQGTVSSELVSFAVEGQISQIATEIRTFLERTPPQIRESVAEEGIYLTGGTTRIPSIDRYLKRVIGCPVNLSGYFEMCTIRGLAELIRNKELQKWAYTIGKKK
jgi:rod shape-determining protein MreB